MKHNLAFSLMVLLLLMGCKHHRAVSPRLVELDSLIAVAPDSAAALLQAIPADSLTDPENRAYHALLLTQARYKAYIPATSDSDINIAVDYFVTKKDGNYDRRIRSLIYKGCVMTELNQPDSAMYWFKSAETAARPDDHANLGYINYRMGELCMDEHEFESQSIRYLSSALEHFSCAHNTEFELSCLVRLGSLYLLTDKTKANIYFHKASQLSQSDCDSIFVTKILLHCALKAIDESDYMLAKELSLRAIEMKDSSLTAFASASIGYSGLHQKDSARFFLELMPNPTNQVDAMLCHQAHAELSRALNNMEDYVFHNDLAGRISDTIFMESQQAEIKEIEQKYENQVLTEKIKTSHIWLGFIGAVLAIVIMSALMLVYKLRNQSKERFLTETRFQQTIGQLSDLRQVIAQKEQEINLLKRDTSNKELLKYRLQSCDTRLKCLDDIIQGFHLLQQDRTTVKKRKVAMSTSFWQNLELCVRSSFGKLFDSSKDLSDKEQKLLHLCCLNVPIELCAIMLDVSLKTVQNYRTNIAKIISAHQTSNLDSALDMFRDHHDE